MSWFKSFWKTLNTPMPQELHDLGEMPHNFTPRAQQVLTLARKEADRFHHNFVGTEHLLLGLISLGQGTAVNVLQHAGIHIDNVREEVKNRSAQGRTKESSDIFPYTPRVKKVLALAAKEAKALNHTHVGTEHILLGLLREGEGVAARVLTGLGLNLTAVRESILKELDPNYSLALSEVAITPQDKTQKLQPDPIDISIRYDVYCREGDQETIYPNVLFKDLRTLFPQNEYDALSEFLELEQADKQTIFIARGSVTKFCEHGGSPQPE
jgi:ATP-dependent Clp protease ATP-binding subunit ClpA